MVISNKEPRPKGRGIKKKASWRSSCSLLYSLPWFLTYFPIMFSSPCLPTVLQTYAGNAASGGKFTHHDSIIRESFGRRKFCLDRQYLFSPQVPDRLCRTWPLYPKRIGNSTVTSQTDVTQPPRTSRPARPGVHRSAWEPRVRAHRGTEVEEGDAGPGVEGEVCPSPPSQPSP